MKKIKVYHDHVWFILFMQVWVNVKRKSTPNPPRFQNKGEKASQEIEKKTVDEIKQEFKAKSLKTGKVNIDITYLIS